MKQVGFYECKCLAKVREKLTAYYGDGSNVELELKQTIDMETMMLGAALPPLHFTYLYRKKNGKTVRRRSFVVFSYCPFCGQKVKGWR